MIRVAGAGPGHVKYLTFQTYEAIKEAKKVIAFGRIGESFKELRQDIIKVNRVFELLEYCENQEDLLILASGDPLFFGVTNFLKRNGIIIDEIYPGISSVQYLMAKTQIPWQDANLFSVHGREFDINTLLDKSLSIGLVDKKHSPNWISKSLFEKGARGKIKVGSNLSYEKESIIEGRIGDHFIDDESLSVVVVEIDLD